MNICRRSGHYDRGRVRRILAADRCRAQTIQRLNGHARYLIRRNVLELHADCHLIVVCLDAPRGRIKGDIHTRRGGCGKAVKVVYAGR